VACRLAPSRGHDSLPVLAQARRHKKTGTLRPVAPRVAAAQAQYQLTPTPIVPDVMLSFRLL
jgi:hypothetical protein